MRALPLVACLWILVLALTIVTLAPSIAIAEEPPILFTADELTYDSKNKITQARGNVEIVRGDRILLADTVTYNEPQDLVTATGNVSILEASGDVYFAEYAEVTGDLKTGFIEHFYAILADGTRIAAVTGEREDGNTTIAHKAVYSPCDICPEDPEKPPIWQIKSVKVVHDQNEKIITFKHAWLEFAGIPVFYTPYFSQPDPTVKRKSGFLAPDYGFTTDLGFILQVPYFWAIAPNIDLTLAPTLTTEEGPLLEGEYRHRLTNGKIDFAGSIIYDSNQQLRGHAFNEFRYDIDKTWRMGLDARYASDRTYLRKYGYDDSSSLTSRLFAEGFRSRNYLVANGYAFQTQDSSVNQDTVPIVLPQIGYKFVGEPDSIGGRATADLDLSVFTRDKGTDTRRLSVRPGWDLPLIGPLGGLYTISAALWADGYQVNDEVISGRNSKFTGVTGRLFPQAGITWRMPFVRPGETFSQEIQPKIEFIAAPNYGNPSKIPDEDSEAFQFDESNLFGFKRFPGIDRIQPGSRVNYGLEYNIFGGRDIFGGSDASAMVQAGQSYSFKQHGDLFPQSSGLKDNLSDFIGAVRISPKKYVELLWRTRLDKDTLTFRRNELGANVGVDALKLDTTYIFYDSSKDDSGSTQFEEREEISATLNAQLSRYWRTRFFGVRDLTGDTNRTLGVGVTYEDECLVVGVEYSREDFREADIAPEDRVFFRVAFKTIGEVETGFKHRQGEFR